MEKVQFLNYFQDGVCFKKLKFVGANDRIVKKNRGKHGSNAGNAVRTWCPNI